MYLHENSKNPFYDGLGKEWRTVLEKIQIPARITIQPRMGGAVIT